MLKLRLIILMSIIMALTASGMDKHKQVEKTGILLVSFGTSYANAQSALNHIDTLVKEAFPGVEVRWAFTSNIIRNILKKRGHSIDSPAEALAKMGADGFTKIAVQSLHIIPGEEFETLRKTVSAFNHIPKNTQKIVLGAPLLNQHEDIVETCNALHSILPAKLKTTDAMVFMGHGTQHPSNIYYPGVQYYLWQHSPLIFLGTVEGYPGLDKIISGLKAKKVKTVWLQPFMSVAGDHAQNDMAGDEPDSWKSQLETAGFEVKPILKGLGEFDAIDAIWIKHLKEVVNELQD
ncbi:MAG: sirohydrochlorin cobaltochelatase [Draconibacterium sp.]|nr:MAG: sirohydrochlorin cobaltochelatase [Draconibacterium sp.]PIF06583.1 MAG: sirohydrochlorin cobaltochelatase [Draconibacterium sp.]